MTSTVLPRPVTLGRVVALTAAAGLVPLNSTMIAVALPAIADDFSVATSTVSILITTYLVIMLAGQPLAGRLADRVGSRQLVELALTGVAVSSVAAALAPAFWFLIAARGVQALFAAALVPGVQSLLVQTTTPVELGRVFGILGSVLGIGAAAGPIVGGFITQLFDWWAIFLFNVPIAVAAIVTIRMMPVAPVDPIASGRTTSGRIANGVFTSAYLGQALSTFGQYALLLLTPLVLDARGWEAGPIGLALSTLTVGMIVMGPVGGRLGDRVGPRRVAVVGLTVASIGLGVLAYAAPDVDPVILVIGLTVFGLGLGATSPNLMTAGLGSVPPGRTGAAAGILSTARYLGSIGSTVALAAVVSQATDGADTLLTMATFCLVASAVTATRLPGPAAR